MDQEKIKELYSQLGAEIGLLVGEKQISYGDSFGKSGAVLRILYPDGIRKDQYDDMLTLARMLDKMFRIANDPHAFGENPYRDLTGYSLLGAKRYQDQEQQQAIYNREYKDDTADPAAKTAYIAYEDQHHIG